ncbi:ocs element-binding factor 1 [Musa troglodytarum]|uniref:Ocs element-binding factor 1 n=1 Tax=Musa troglodytarum TaxID=320322 RepID=A0A9E7JBX6_9LILI|nr:ocs element-binding factor 1 [Musa troglodytarum]
MVELSNRLQSLNDILHCLKAKYSISCGPMITDNFINPLLRAPRATWSDSIVRLPQPERRRYSRLVALESHLSMADVMMEFPDRLKLAMAVRLKGGKGDGTYGRFALSKYNTSSVGMELIT